PIDNGTQGDGTYVSSSGPIPFPGRYNKRYHRSHAIEYSTKTNDINGLPHVMQHQGRYMVGDDDQFLLYVAGEGDTGKSWVIEALRVGMKLWQRDQEVLVIAPTGNAAKHVQGSTVHTGLNVPVKGNRKKITEEL